VKTNARNPNYGTIMSQTTSVVAVTECYFSENVNKYLFFCEVATAKISVDGCHIRHNGDIFDASVSSLDNFVDDFKTLKYKRCVIPSDKMTAFVKETNGLVSKILYLVMLLHASE
jgi:hypothetical protein